MNENKGSAFESIPDTFPLRWKTYYSFQLFTNEMTVFKIIKVLLKLAFFNNIVNAEKRKIVLQKTKAPEIGEKKGKPIS